MFIKKNNNCAKNRQERVCWEEKEQRHNDLRGDCELTWRLGAWYRRHFRLAVMWHPTNGKAVFFSPTQSSTVSHIKEQVHDLHRQGWRQKGCDSFLQNWVYTPTGRPDFRLHLSCSRGIYKDPPLLSQQLLAGPWATGSAGDSRWVSPSMPCQPLLESIYTSMQPLHYKNISSPVLDSCQFPSKCDDQPQRIFQGTVSA